MHSFSDIRATLILFLLGMSFANSSLALNACPNPQVGVNGGSPAIYSDCTMDTGGTTEYHLIMEVVSGTTIRVNGYSNAAAAYAPPPIGTEEFGTWDGSTLRVVDMGASYSGDCDEVTGSSNSIPVVSGNVYCGIVGNTLGERVLLRGTWNGSTFTNYQILTDAVGVGTPVAPTTYTIGGALSGLATGESVVLQNNAGDDLTLSTDGNFTFSTAINSGTNYAVTVLTQPTNQTCTVTNGTGTASADVTNVAVSCSTNTYTIGGSASGLATGESVVLQNNAGDDLTVNANGSFTFSTAINSGTNYAVTVLTQPTNQTCTVTNGTGTASADVTNVGVSCSNDDTDGDGIDDASDPYPNADTEESVGGVTLSTTPANSSSSCSIEALSSASTYPSPRPASLENDIGIAVDYSLNGCSTGESISVTVDFGVAIPEGGRVFKVTSSGWTEIGGAVISGTTATYTLTDNGELDQDPTAGRILDPVAAAVPAPATPVPALPLGALWILGGLAGLLGMRQLRKAA